MKWIAFVVLFWTAPICASAQDWLSLERDLAALYLPTGAVDGEVDERTHEAVRLFQYSFGHPVKNRLTPRERKVLSRAAKAATRQSPFVFEEDRDVWETPENLFLQGTFNRFARRIFASGPHFMANRTELPFHPENLDVSSSYFTTNTKRVAAYSDQAHAFAANSTEAFAKAIYLLSTNVHEEPDTQNTLAGLETALLFAEANPGEAAMTALLTSAAQRRFPHDLPCRDMPDADKFSKLLIRAVVAAQANRLEPYKWSALVQRAIECTPAQARDGLYQLRLEHSFAVSDFARRQVLVEWARDSLKRDLEDQARENYLQAMDLLDARPLEGTPSQSLGGLIDAQDAIEMSRLGMTNEATKLAQAHVDFILARPPLRQNAARAEASNNAYAGLQAALMLLELGNADLLNLLGIDITPVQPGSDPTVLRGQWYAAQLGLRHLKEREEHSSLVQAALRVLPEIKASHDQKSIMVVNLLIAEAAAELGDFDLAETYLTNAQRVAALNGFRQLINDRVVTVLEQLSVSRLANLPTAERVIQQFETYFGDDCEGNPHRDGADFWPYPELDFANFSSGPAFREIILASDLLEKMVSCTPAKTIKNTPTRIVQPHAARGFCAIAAIHGRADLVTSVLNSKNSVQPNLNSTIWCIYGLTDVGITAWMNRAGWALGDTDTDYLYNLMIATPQQRVPYLENFAADTTTDIGLNEFPWVKLELARPPAQRLALLNELRGAFRGAFGNMGPQEEDYRDKYLAGIALKKLGLFNMSEALFYLDDRVDPFKFGNETQKEISEDLLDIRSVQKRLDYARLYRVSKQYDRARAAISPLVEVAVARLSSSDDPLPGTIEQWSERLSEMFRLYLNLQFDPGEQSPNYNTIFLVQQFIQAGQSTASLSVLEQRLNSSTPEAARAYQDARRIVRAMMQDNNADPDAMDEATARLRAAEDELNAGDAALQGHQIGVIRSLQEATGSLGRGDSMLVITQLEDVMIQTLLTKSTVQARRLPVSMHAAVERVAQFRNSITRSTKELDLFDVRSARGLYDDMLGWSANQRVSQRLNIVADTPWATLPFGALKTGDGWLAQTTALRLSPSVARSVARVRRQTPNPAEQGSGFIGIGDPIMTKYEERPGVSPGTRLAALPETQNELINMALAFGGDLKNDVFTRSNATEEVFRTLNAEKRLSRSRILALATHGLLSHDLEGSGGAALVLSDPSSGREDGFLSASEIFTYQIGADLVILSACNTGTPDAASGMSDLASAFFYAGAGKLLLTHWEIDSGAALELMKHFARDFRGQTAVPEESLRKAVDVILSDPRLSNFHHPRFWAGHFVIS